LLKTKKRFFNKDEEALRVKVKIMFTGKSCLKIIQAQKICSISRNVLRESNKILRRNISIKATKEQQEKLERELKFRKLNGKNEQDDGYDCWSFTDRAGIVQALLLLRLCRLYCS
jgi:FAD synthase